MGRGELSKPEELGERQWRWRVTAEWRVPMRGSYDYDVINLTATLWHSVAEAGLMTLETCTIC